MPIGFLKRQGDKPLLTSVSRENPLPVEIHQFAAGDIPSEPHAFDTLVYTAGLTPTSSDTASFSNIDLLGNTDNQTATIIRAEQYRRFILIGWRPSTTNATSITFDLYARATDASGTPLHVTGDPWVLIGSFSTASTTTQGYFRLILEHPDGKPLGFDQYRICVRRNTTGSSLNINTVLRGER